MQLVPRLARRQLALLAAIGCVALAYSMLSTGMPVLSSGTAGADTAPPKQNTPLTVAADALPTVQVNGVVWDQLVVGNTVYATGEFTEARPPGSAPGTNETPRSNILAYNLTTGELISSWAPALNAQGMALAASEDQTKIFVVGDFTQIDGINRYRIAALHATTGAVLDTFTP